MHDTSELAQITDDTLPVRALFNHVIGQDRIVDQLRRSALQPFHAYLFTGSQGAGMESGAIAFSAALLCPNGGCNNCSVCARVLSNNHPDLVSIRPSSRAFSVEDAINAINVVRYTPLEASRIVVIMHNVHLAYGAAPVLLKTIEEPPPNVFFLLLAEDIPPGLATIASRCIEIPFPRLPRQEIISWLKAQGADDSMAELVANGADGDLKRASNLFADQGFAGRLALWQSVPQLLDGRGNTVGELVRKIQFVIDESIEPLRARHVVEMDALEDEAKALGEKGVGGRKAITDEFKRIERRFRTDELRAGLGVLAGEYRDQIREFVSKTALKNAPNPGSISLLKHHERAIKAISQAAKVLGRNPNEMLLLESLFLTIGPQGS